MQKSKGRAFFEDILALLKAYFKVTGTTVTSIALTPEQTELYFKYCREERDVPEEETIERFFGLETTWDAPKFAIH